MEMSTSAEVAKEPHSFARKVVRALLPRSVRDFVARVRYGRAARYYARFGVRGLWLASTLAGKPSSVPIEVNIPRARGPVSVRCGTADVFVFEQIFIEEQYALSRSFRPTRIVDLGANIGLSSVYFAERWPNARIDAVEPHPENFALLKRNVAAYPQIRPIQAAVWGRKTKLSLVNPTGMTWSFRYAEAKGSCEVDALTVAELLVDSNSSDVVLVKLDVEGAEREVMAESEDWLPRIDALMLELHEDRAPGAKAALDRALVHSRMDARVRGETVIVARSASLADLLRV